MKKSKNCKADKYAKYKNDESYEFIPHQAVTQMQFPNGGQLFGDIGAGVLGAAQGVAGTMTGGLTDPLFQAGKRGLQGMEHLTPQQIQEQNNIYGIGQGAGAIGAGIATGNVLGAGKEGLGAVGSLKYALGGVNRGDANAEIEKQEVVRYPDGGTDQSNGPSHDQGGVPVNLPDQTQIFSDRLKVPGTKDTFAKQAAKFKTDKWKKQLDDPKTNAFDKETAKRMFKRNTEALDQLFSEQESMKQGKLAAYSNKLGITSNPPAGENDQNSQSEMGQSVQGGQNIPQQPQSEDQTPNNQAAYGGTMYAKGGKHWIQGAVNPAHKGYCTPMTKSTCTPARKAFAMTMKKHHGFHKHEFGGVHEVQDQGQFGIDPFHPNLYSTNQFAGGGVYANGGGFDDTADNPFTSFLNSTNNPSFQSTYDKVPDANQIQGTTQKSDWVGEGHYDTDNNNPDYTPDLDPSGMNEFLSRTNTPGSNNAANTSSKPNIGQYGNYIGGAYDVARGIQDLRNPRNVNFGVYNPQMVNYQGSRDIARRDIQEGFRSGQENLKNINNPGQYYSNLQGMAANRDKAISDNVSRSYENQANTNAQIGNQGQMYNIGNKYQADLGNLAEKDVARNTISNGLSTIGRAAGGNQYDVNGRTMDATAIASIKRTNPDWDFVNGNWKYIGKTQ